MVQTFFRYITFVLVGCCLMACSEDNDADVLPTPPDPVPTPTPTPPSPGEGLTFAITRQVIQANGKDSCDFVIKYDGLELDDDFTVYNENDESIGAVKSFATTEPGEYKFWVAYKAEHTEMLTVKAISIPVPKLPGDPFPERTDFTKRVLLTQFTGTGCQYCPYMTSCVLEAFKDEAYAKKTIWCIAHTFNRSDPGYLTDDRLEQSFGISSYPSINIDFISSFAYQRNFTAESIRSIIDQAYEFPANAGVSAKAELIEETDGTKKIALHVAVKAAADGEYSVGAWIMEDSIKARQSTDGHIEGNFDTHNNTLRVVDSKAGFNNYTGIELGHIAKGKVAEHVFIMTMKDRWVLENCHAAIFVTQKKNNESYVTNVVPCPIQGELSFDYLKE